MRLWIMSDIHLELTRGWDLPPVGARPEFDVLIVAGDLVPRMERGVRWLADRVPDKPAILVPGNHESYGTDIDRTLEKALEAAKGTTVHVLQNRAVKIRSAAKTGDVTFAGATLWTDFDLYGDARRAIAVAGERMNDSKKIRKKGYAERFLPRDALARHKDSRAFIEAELHKDRGDGKLVVVSHHAPVPDPRFPTPETGGTVSDEKMLDAAYRSDLTALMSPQPAGDGRDALLPADLWVFGHTHESFDAVVGGTRVVSNAKGYGPWPPRERTWENARFDPNFVIEI
jgi:predicted phosphodiesterase